MADCEIGELKVDKPTELEQIQDTADTDAAFELFYDLIDLYDNDSDKATDMLEQHFPLAFKAVSTETNKIFGIEDTPTPKPST